jgi:CheY-like chemotaxis protein/HPt (histidine-containing phosphotransfer) domain-containing protein
MLGTAADRRLPTVLLIDDDLISREVIATVLTMSGYTVQTAENGPDSLAILDDGTFAPQVILMDTQMPGLSGSALIDQLRTRTKAPLYAISGSEPPPDVIKAADGFLLKPFGPDILERTLQRHITHPEPTPIADSPVVNETTLAQLRGVMPEKGVREIFTAIAADLEKRHDLLVAAIERGDSAEIKRIGHAIKGGSGMAGAMQVMKLGQLLEARGDDLEYSRSLLADLQTATRNLRRMLDAELSPRIDPAV